MTIRDFLERHQRRVDIRQLQDCDELGRILGEAKTMGISFDQAPNYPDVISARQDMGENQARVPVYLSETDKAHWWIVRQYRQRSGADIDYSFTFLLKSILRGQFVDPVVRLLDKCRMRSELRSLRRSGRLDQILIDSDYAITRGDQGDDFVHVYHKENRSKGAELFSAYSRNEVIWWVLKRGRKDQTTNDR